METYSVRLSSASLTFSAAHFITFGSNQCEPLHGHNYRVSAEVHGPLTSDWYVIDFIVLHDMLRAILQDLDHRMLVPTRHPAVQIHKDSERDEVELRFQDRRWVLPCSDCALLPIANTTAELIAQHIASRLCDDMCRRFGSRPTRMRIEVEECFGQSAACELIADSAEPRP